MLEHISPRHDLPNVYIVLVCCAHRAAHVATCEHRVVATVAAALRVCRPPPTIPGPAHALERSGVEVSGSAALLWA
eukprot:6200294-Pleurochrysis_carterae.AAC.2